MHKLISLLTMISLIASNLAFAVDPKPQIDVGPTVRLYNKSVAGKKIDQTAREFVPAKEQASFSKLLAAHPIGALPEVKAASKDSVRFVVEGQTVTFRIVDPAKGDYMINGKSVHVDPAASLEKHFDAFSKAFEATSSTKTSWLDLIIPSAEANLAMGAGIGVFVMLLLMYGYRKLNPLPEDEYRDEIEKNGDRHLSRCRETVEKLKKMTPEEAAYAVRMLDGSVFDIMRTKIYIDEAVEFEPYLCGSRGNDELCMKLKTLNRCDNEQFDLSVSVLRKSGAVVNFERQKDGSIGAISVTNGEVPNSKPAN